MGELVRFWIQVLLTLMLGGIIVSNTVKDLGALGWLVVCAVTCGVTAIWSFVDAMDKA